MAMRNIRKMGDTILNKPCREVKEMTEKISILIDDMLETMYETFRKDILLYMSSTS